MCNCDCKETQEPDSEASRPPFDVDNDLLRVLVDEARASLKAVQATENVLCDIFDERGYQNGRWGQQNHPDGTAIYYEFEQGIAKARMNEAVQYGHVTWTHILLEEVFEAVSETHPDKLRPELVQIAAVCTAWIEAIDRRA